MKVIPRASREKVMAQGPGQYKVYLRAPALEGKANEALVELLSGHFKVSKSSVRILRGEKNRNKVVEINA